MPLFPLFVQQTRPTWLLTWQDDLGNPINLTSATITLRIRPGHSAQAIAGGGVITILPQSGATLGQFTYAPVAADLIRPDQNYDLQFKAVFGDATVLYHDVLTGPVLMPV